MRFSTKSAPAENVAADWLIVPIFAEPELAGGLAVLNDKLGGTIGQLIEAKDLKGDAGKLLSIYLPGGVAAKRLLFAGLGEKKDFDRGRWSKTIGTAVRQLSDDSELTVAVDVTDLGGTSLSMEALLESAAIAVRTGCVGQDFYREKPSRHEFSEVIFITPTEQPEAVSRGDIIGESVNVTRELVNRAAHEIYPESFANEALRRAEAAGITCEVFDEDWLRQERMNSLLAVAAGSARPARLVRLEYRGKPKSDEHIAWVGKGVTFDSGGLSIKPSEGMTTMKCDMAGAATVLGAMLAAARMKLPVNLVGYLGLVENMISGTSYKLGDVLTARNGTTIEVLNTDAEGRLVLADVLCLAADQGAAKIIDLATLTGACVVALGEDVTGTFTNDQAWGDAVAQAAATAGEHVWQLPMFDFYSDLLKSDVADCKNIGGRWGGAITAAKFLEKFVGERPWVHLDIAGPSFAASSKPHRDGGATGCMVATLVELARTL